MASILGFILVLIPLVIIHELGHFLFAKLFNVRADAFSIGFGPVLFSRKIGETDFRVSAIPLGGYVKLLGEDPTTELTPEEKARALHHQKPWKRFFVFFGGPLFNFLWAIVVFMAMMAIGEPQMSTKFGRVLADSPAQKAGFVAGDKIVSVDGAPVSKIEELAMILNDKPDQKVVLGVERAGAVNNIPYQTQSEDGFSIYGESKKVGVIDGLVPNARMTKVAISNPESIAAKAGIQTADEVIALNGIKVDTFEALESTYHSIPVDLLSKKPVTVELELKRANQAPMKVTLTGVYSGSLAADFGLHSSELFVEQTMPDSPAAKAGILKGDRIVSVNGFDVRSFFELRLKIQAAGEAIQKAKDENVANAPGTLQIAVERAGKLVQLDIAPQVSTERDPMMKKMKQFTVGVAPIPTMMEPDMVIVKILNPFKLLYLGTERMLDFTAKNFISIGKMIQGQVSVKSLGGPILIGKLAGDSITRGLIDFLKMMAILSIGLGVLNILPIPVLDGGHIVLLGLEAVRGKALSLKQMEIAQQVGLVFILGIMIIVMKNDISRLPIFN
jgi:regulator of sigma E protease